MTLERPIGGRENALRESPLAHSYWPPGSHISSLATLNTQKHHQSQVYTYSYFWIEKSPKNPLTRYNLARNINGEKTFSSGHNELYMFKVSGVKYALSHPD
jgi:hypothetical protein